MAEQTKTAEPKAGGGPWIPLESNPEVFNSWAHKLGMAQTAHFEDIYGLDPELLAMVTKPVKAVLMIFPISPQMEQSRRVDDEKMRKDGVSPNVDKYIFFIEQKIGNACGTIGLLHALLNSDVTINPLSSLAQFQEKCMDLSPSDRADLLAKTALFAQAHSAAATSTESSSTVPTNLDTDLHFTCFVPSIDGVNRNARRLVELDGRRVGPVDHGAATDDILKDVSTIVKEKYLKLSTSMQFFTMTRNKQMANREKRIELVERVKRQKAAEKFKERLARKRKEVKDPEMKKKRIEENVPITIDNMREHDPTMLTAPTDMHPNHRASSSKTAVKSEGATETDVKQETIDSENMHDIANDPFAAYFHQTGDPTLPPKVLITTSPRFTTATREFCEELVGVFPGAKYVQRSKRGSNHKCPSIGKLATWAGERGYGALVVVNDDQKEPNAITMVHLPEGPTAYFKLTSVQLTKRIFGHARASPHNPELILNGFVTRLGHAVGRMFQTLFPPMPEFEGRQVVTLHNQRDFLFFRRHRYVFHSTEKAGLQEIGPRFTLKLRSMRQGLPAVNKLGAPMRELEIAKDEDDEDPSAETRAAEALAQEQEQEQSLKKAKKDGKRDEFAWVWKPELEVNKRTFFL
ncbi:hypothetical protein FRB98_005107 [Tulasnella sp. 332]|nr:hypothetical protein FRB98_005107 [Tulasnella sp. 332]